MGKRLVVAVSGLVKREGEGVVKAVEGPFELAGRSAGERRERGCCAGGALAGVAAADQIGETLGVMPIKQPADDGDCEGHAEKA